MDKLKKFKAGDFVKILSDSSLHGIEIGSIQKIEERIEQDFYPFGCYYLVGGSNGCKASKAYVYRTDLEKIPLNRQQVQKRKFKRGDLVRVIKDTTSHGIKIGSIQTVLSICKTVLYPKSETYVITANGAIQENRLPMYAYIEDLEKVSAKEKKVKEKELCDCKNPNRAIRGNGLIECSCGNMYNLSSVPNKTPVEELEVSGCCDCYFRFWSDARCKNYCGAKRSLELPEMIIHTPEWCPLKKSDLLIKLK